MARPRKKSEEAAIVASDVPLDIVNTVKLLTPLQRAQLFAQVEETPPRRIDGKPNINHYLHRMHRINRIAEERAVNGESVPNAKQVVAAIKVEAEADGFTRESLEDTRSEADKYRDTTKELCRNANTIWNQTEPSLRIALRECARLADVAGEVFDEWCGIDRFGEIRITPLPEEEEDEPDEKKSALAMCTLLRQVLRVQQMAREPVPKGAKISPSHRWRWAATWLLRFMLYTARSDMAGKKKEGQSLADERPEESLFKFDRPHVEMAGSIWVAEEGIVIRNHKMVKRENGLPWSGVVIVAPPGLGKSELAIGWVTRHLCKNPRDQGGYLHAVEDMAIQKVAKIIDHFKDDTDVGKRTRALFPAVRIDKKNSKMTGMRLLGFDKTADAQIYSAGVMSAGLSRNAGFLVCDDVVPPSDAEQSTVRELRHKTLASTWFSRLRGVGGVDHFKLVIANCWHVDDAIMRLIRDAEKSELVTKTLRVGGPHTTPKFKSIWPAVQPAKELERRFNEMDRNIRLWSAAYMADPQPEELRIVRRLRFYDPCGADMAEFLKNATFGLSLDPAGSNREKADKAGIVYYAVGDVRYRDKDGNEQVEPRLRFIDALQISATQSELVERSKYICLERKVDRIHVEGQSGYLATAEMLEAIVGADHIIVHTPGNKSKEIRLRKAAPALDDAAATMAGFRATAEFPGIRNDEGRIVGDDDRFGKWYRQILNFGSESEDHYLDATTQVVNHCTEKQEISVIGGLVSAVVRAQAAARQDERVMAYIRRTIAEKNGDDGGPEEAQGWQDQHDQYADRMAMGGEAW